MRKAIVARLVVGAAAALSLGMMSTSASAQYGNEEYCSRVAWVVCGYDSEGHRIQPTFDCVDAEFQRCMDGYAALHIKKPGDYDKRRYAARLQHAQPL